MDRQQHAGHVYDFTIPGDETFWAEGVLVHNCGPCKAVNGKWLGNSIIENVNRLYPTGGYIDCQGRDRCRGQVIGIWRPKQVGDR